MGLLTTISTRATITAFEAWAAMMKPAFGFAKFLRILEVVTLLSARIKGAMKFGSLR
jgi:hypothetical protein